MGFNALSPKMGFFASGLLQITGSDGKTGNGFIGKHFADITRISMLWQKYCRRSPAT